MSNLPYKNPISPLQVYGSSTVDRSKTFGTSFSVLNTGGFMEVYSLSDLNYTIPTGQTGNVEITGNTIPIQFKKGSGSVFSPDVLTLNSDNISSGRRRLGMLVYVYETNKIYQYTINDYDNLWLSASTASGPGGNTVIISDFGTTVKNNTPEGQNFINAWTASTIEGVSGYTNLNATWRELKTGGSSGGTDTYVTGFTLNGDKITLSQNRIDQYSAFTITLTGLTGTTSGGTVSGDYLPLSGGTVSGDTTFKSGLTANTISAITYQNLPNTLYTGDGTLLSDRIVDLSSYTLNFSSSTNPNTLVLSGGSVGIGISTPTGGLDVKGQVTLRSDTNNDTTLTLYTYQNNPWTIKSSASLGNRLAVYAPTASSGTTKLIELENYNDNTVPILNFAGGLFATGNAHYWGINNDRSKTYSSTFVVKEFSNNLYTLGVSDSTDTIVAGIKSSGDGYFSGNVGIGTPSPSYKLDVSGTGIVSRFGSTTNGYWYMNSNQTNGNRLEFVNFGDLNINGQYGSIIENNTYDTKILGGYYQSYISLGTITPGYPEHKTKATLFLQTGNFGINVGTGDTGYKFTSIGTGLSGSANIDNVFYVNNSNVGIGTISPTNKLHVSATTDPVKIVGLTATTSDTNVITIDSDGVLHTTPFSGISGSSSSLTFSNGLTRTNNDVVLGGTLTATTTTLLDGVIRTAITDTSLITIGGTNTSYNYNFGANLNIQKRYSNTTGSITSLSATSIAIIGVNLHELKTGVTYSIGSTAFTDYQVWDRIHSGILGNIGFGASSSAGTITFNSGKNLPHTNYGIFSKFDTWPDFTVNSTNVTKTFNGWYSLYGGFIDLGGGSGSTLERLMYYSAGGYRQTANNKITISEAMGLYVAPLKSNLTGITSSWGIYQEGLTDKNYFGGNVGIGITGASNPLHISASTDPVRIVGLSATTTDVNLLSVDSNGVIHSYFISGITSNYLPLSGGTVTGGTIFQSGLTANTISATTYYNLPFHYFISGSTPTGVTINYGDRWYNTNNGIELVYIADGDSSQWVQPANTPGPPGYSNLMITSGITTSAATLDINTNYYGVNYNGIVNLTLPNPSGYDGYNITIKDEGGYSSIYRIRLTPMSGLIDGNTYVDMNLNYIALHLVARNNNWWLI